MIYKICIQLKKQRLSCKINHKSKAVMEHIFELQSYAGSQCDSQIDSHQNSTQAQDIDQLLPEMVFYGNRKQPVKLAEVVKSLQGEQTPQKQLQTIILLRMYFTSFSKSRIQQARLLQQIDLIDILKRPLISKNNILLVQTFNLLFSLTSYFTERDPVYKRIFKDNFELLAKLILDVLKINHRRVIHNALRMLLHCISKKTQETLQFILEENLIVDIYFLLTAKRLTHAFSTYGVIVSKFFSCIQTTQRILSEQQIFSVMSLIIYCTQKTKRLRRIAKILTSNLTTYLTDKIPFMPNCTDQLSKLLNTIKPFSSEFLQLFICSAKFLNIAQIISEQLMQHLLLLLGNQEPYLHQNIVMLAYYLCERIHFLTPPCQILLRQLIKNIIKKKLPDIRAYQISLVILFHKIIQNRNLFFEEQHYPYIVKNLARIYNQHPSTSRVITFIIENFLARDILELKKDDSSVEQEEDIIRTTFNAFGEEIVRQLTMRYKHFEI